MPTAAVAPGTVTSTLAAVGHDAPPVETSLYLMATVATCPTAKVTRCGEPFAAASKKLDPPRRRAVGSDAPLAARSRRFGYPRSEQGEPLVLVRLRSTSRVPAAPPAVVEAPVRSPAVQRRVGAVVVVDVVELAEVEVLCGAVVAVVDVEEVDVVSCLVPA
jgi:hypothetical protein